jgi:hypothetical protein
MWYDGSTWLPSVDLGGGLHSDVAVSSWGLRWLDLFREGDNNTLQHRLWDGRSWTRWEIIGTGIDDTPSAISWDENRIDVLALGTNGQLLHKHFPVAERTS